MFASVQIKMHTASKTDKGQVPRKGQLLDMNQINYHDARAYTTDFSSPLDLLSIFLHCMRKTVRWHCNQPINKNAHVLTRFFHTALRTL
jgi:hypothetical protein